MAMVARSTRPIALGFSDGALLRAYARGPRVTVVAGDDAPVLRAIAAEAHVQECFIAAGRLVLHSGTLTAGKRVEGWSLATGDKCWDMPLSDGVLAIDEGTNRIACLDAGAEEMAVCDLVTGELVASIPVPPEAELPIIAMRGDHVAVADWTGYVAVIVETGRTVYEHRHELGGIDPEALAIDGPEVVVLSLARPATVGLCGHGRGTVRWCVLPLGTSGPLREIRLASSAKVALAATDVAAFLIELSTGDVRAVDAGAPIALSLDGAAGAAVDSTGRVVLVMAS